MDSGGADAGGSGVGAGRVGAAVLHGGIYFNSGGEAVGDDSAGESDHGGENCFDRFEIGIGEVDGGR